MTSSIKGRRLPDRPLGEFPMDYDDLQPGDCWKIMSREDPAIPLTPEDLGHDRAGGNPTGTVWGIITPNGMYAMLSIHTVREHEEDGTISIRPGDGSSNSVLVKGGQDKEWHGYVEHNVWTEC